MEILNAADNDGNSSKSGSFGGGGGKNSSVMKQNGQTLNKSYS